MSDAGVIALDPGRLAGLQARLDRLDHRCRSWARAVEADLADTGTAAPRAVEALAGLAAWCRLVHDDVAWRRALVEGLPHDLPLPAPTFASASRAATAARGDAAEVLDLLAAGSTPPWDRLRPLLERAARAGAASDAYAAAFHVALGGEVAADLPVLVERSARAARDDRWPRVAGRPLAADEAAEVDGVQRGLAEALRRASLVDGALTEAWLADYTGPVDGASEASAAASDAALVALDAAGYGVSFAHALARATGHGTLAVVLRTGEGLVGIVRRGLTGDDDLPLPIDLDAIEADVLEAAGEGLLLVASRLPHPALAITGVLAGGTLLMCALAVRHLAPTDEEERRARAGSAPQVDPATGTTRTPAGHATNPNVDEAGVPSLAVR